MDRKKQRLIAVAPEILEGLKEYMEHFDSNETSEEVLTWLERKWIPTMRKLIAKSEGGSK